jgi:TPR repeat protein
LYSLGKGIPQDYAEALKWYRKAAEHGDIAQAQLQLGLMYQGGLGVPQNDVEAVKWFRKAAEQNIVEAQLQLGLMYANGKGGVPQNDAEAAKWYGAHHRRDRVVPAPCLRVSGGIS